ncbi:MAG: methyltransferase, partial [Cyanobacteria bacterium J06555_12]
MLTPYVRRPVELGRLAIALLCMVSLFLGGCSLLPQASTSDGIYSTRTVHDPDGIGKFYMGREIAQVMGHQGAYWLERSSRIWEEKTLWAIAALDLQPGEVVADIGAGTGFLSFRIAERYPDSPIYAVDVQPEMLDILQERSEDLATHQVMPMLGSETAVNLPDNSVDMAVMLDAYHEFAYPRELMESLTHALKPNGRAVLVEYRKENPLIPIKPAHKMSQRQARKELRAVGL